MLELSWRYQLQWTDKYHVIRNLEEQSNIDKRCSLLRGKVERKAFLLEPFMLRTVLSLTMPKNILYPEWTALCQFIQKYSGKSNKCPTERYGKFKNRVFKTTEASLWVSE